MFNNKIYKESSGMTLVEVLITLAILSIMIVPIFDVFVETKIINHKTVTTVSANFIGQKVLEELKALPSLSVGITTRTEGDFEVTVDIKEISGDLTFEPDGTSVKTGKGTTIPTKDLEIEYKEADDQTELYVEGNKITFAGKDSEDTTDNLFNLRLYSGGSGSLSASLTVNPDSSATNHNLGVVDITKDSPTVLALSVIGDVHPATWSIVNESNFTVDLYEIDDTADLVTLLPTITGADGEFIVHQSKRSQASSGSNETKLYSIELEIRQNGKLYERLISTAKK